MRVKRETELLVRIVIGNVMLDGKIIQHCGLV